MKGDMRAYIAIYVAHRNYFQINDTEKLYY